ncbi:MAG: DUF1573 domain-containing protein [Gemmataceae bacterium]
MRIAFITLLAFFLPCTAATAQQTPWAQKLFKNVKSHDFGTVPKGAQLMHRFKMKNIYTKPLQITGLRVSCGCASATANKRVLQPLEEGYVDVKMDGARFTGPKTIQVMVTFGPKYVSTATLVVSANARPDVVFNPGSVDFGTVQQGQTPTKSIDVEYAGAMDWRITEVIKSKYAPFDIVPKQLYRQGGRVLRNNQVGYQMKVTLRKTAKPGPFSHKLYLVTNDPASPRLAVSIEGTIMASLSVTPNNIAFGTPKVGEKVTKHVVVRGNRPFSIKSIKGLTNDLTTTPIVAARKMVHVVTIHCNPNRAGQLNKTLEIQTSIGDVSLDIRGTAIQ